MTIYKRTRPWIPGTLAVLTMVAAAIAPIDPWIVGAVGFAGILVYVAADRIGRRTDPPEPSSLPRQRVAPDLLRRLGSASKDAAELNAYGYAHHVRVENTSFATTPAALGFVVSTRLEFEPGGLLQSLSLISASQHDDVLRIRFKASYLRASRYAIDIPVPSAVGDERWLAHTESPNNEDWTRWGIAVPLLEAFETQAVTAIENADGYVWLHID